MAERRDHPEEAQGVVGAIGAMTELLLYMMALALLADVATKFVEGLLAIVGDLA